jgi:hypothetical protein
MYWPGTLSGTISDNVLEGTRKDAKGDGTFRLVLSDDGCRCSGSHPTHPTRTSGGGSGPTDTLGGGSS